MIRPRVSSTPHFTIFRTAAEEVSDAKATDEWANEGGHMHAKSGYVVQVSTGGYKVVLNHEDGDDTEQYCDSMREGEAIIRRNTPRPPKRNPLHDHDETAS